MKKTEIKKDVLEVAVKVINYKKIMNDVYATMTLKNGRMTSLLNAYETPEGIILLNISNATTYEFENKDEFNKYIEKKFKLFKSEKEMYVEDWGYSSESYDEWINGAE